MILSRFAITSDIVRSKYTFNQAFQFILKFNFLQFSFVEILYFNALFDELENVVWYILKLIALPDYV